MNTIEELDIKISKEEAEMAAKRLEAIINSGMKLYNPYRAFHFL